MTPRIPPPLPPEAGRRPTKSRGGDRPIRQKFIQGDSRSTPEDSDSSRPPPPASTTAAMPRSTGTAARALLAAALGAALCGGPAAAAPLPAVRPDGGAADKAPW